MIGGLISTALSSGLENVFGNGLISSALCTGAKKEDDFIFEINGVTTVNIYYFTGMGYTPNTPYEYDYSPLPKDTKITNHFSCNRNNSAINNVNYGMIERPITEDGEEITKEKFPEYFTDFPIHDIEHGKYSENMILPKNPKVEIDWGDGNTDTYDIPQFSGANITIDGKTKLYKYFSGYKNLYSGHKYEKAGTYIIKINGFLPSFVLPNGTTRIINWGNIGLRSIYNICTNCTSTIIDFGSPKNLEKVVTSSAIFTRQNSCVIDDISFINNMPSLVNATNMFYYSNIQNIPDNAFTNSKYLCYLSQCFSYIDNEIEVGNNFAKDLTELRQADNLFNYTKVKRIGNNAFYGCKSLYYVMYMFPQNSSNISLESIGNNFMRGCTSLTSVYQLFYYQYKLKKIGAGLLRECPYIRSSQDIFYYCDVLEKVPDNLFYDLEVNPNFVRNRFCFNSFLYKGYNSLWNKPYSELQEYITEIGSNMFSSAFFANGGELYFNTQFSNTFNYTYPIQLEHGNYKSEQFTLYKGSVPDLWNYMDSLYNTATATEPLSKGNYSFAFYGYQRNDWTEISGVNFINVISNYEPIPKPSGNLIYSHIPLNDQLWLQCTYWNEYHVTVNIKYPANINVSENGVTYDVNDIRTQTFSAARFIIFSPDGTVSQNKATHESFDVEFTHARMLNLFGGIYHCTLSGFDLEAAHASSFGTVSVFALPFVSKIIFSQHETGNLLYTENVSIQEVITGKILAESYCSNYNYRASINDFVTTYYGADNTARPNRCVGGLYNATFYGERKNISPYILPSWNANNCEGQITQKYVNLNVNTEKQSIRKNTNWNMTFDVIQSNDKKNYAEDSENYPYLSYYEGYWVDSYWTSYASGTAYEQYDFLAFTEPDRDAYRKALLE